MKKKWVKTIVALVVALSLAGGGYYGYKRFFAKSKAVTAVNLSTAKATRGNIETTVSASGTVTSTSEYDITTSNSGVVESVNFKEGDTVKKGDVIAKIKDKDTEKSIANSQLTLAQKSMDLGTLQKNYNTNYISSPIAGRIKSLVAEAGDDLSNLKALDSIAVISRDGKMKVSVDVPSGSDANSVVTKNETVDVDVNGQTVQGTVTSTSLSRDTNTEKSIKSTELSISEKKTALDGYQKSLDNLYVKAPVSGKVKSVIAQPGDNASNLKAAGPLMYINKDGKMKITVNIEAGTNANVIVVKGDSVLVYLGDNCIATGTVLTSSVQKSGTNSDGTEITNAGTVSIEINTDTYPINTEVSVYKTNGSDIKVGTGKLSLSDPVEISAGSGVISSLYVSENSVVNKGDNLLKYSEDDINTNIANTKKEIEQLQNDLQTMKTTIASNQSSGATSGTGSGSLVVTIPQDDLPVDATVTVKKQNSDHTVIGTGDLEINDPVKITGSSGVIDKVYVSENSVVKKGDNLFKLNGDSIQVSMASKNIEIQQAQMDLDNYQTNLDKTTLVSPIDGVLSAQNLNVGDNVSSNKVAATVFNPNQLKVVVTVDELDIPKVKIGQKARVTLDAITDKTYTGEVSNIAVVGKTSNSVTTYDVTINIDNPESMKTGMSVTAKIITNSKENVLLLPVNAVQKRADGYVVVTSDGSANTAGANGSANPQSSANSKTGNTSSSNQTKQNTTAGSGGTPNTSGGNANTQKAQDNTGSTNQSAANTAGSSNQASQNSTANSAQTAANKGTNNQQNPTASGSQGQSSQNNVKSVKVGISNDKYIEIVSGISEGESVLVSNQKTTASTSTSTTKQNNNQNFR